MKVYWYILCFGITISCSTTKNWKVVEKNLDYGRENCVKEILRILNDDLFNNHIAYLGSYPEGVIAGYTGTSFIYDKKFKEIPSFYNHRFKLEKDSLINHVFTLVSDADGQFLIEHNNKYRDYPELKEYARLLKNKEELNKLIDLGMEYFGDKRFSFSFSYSSFDIDYSIGKEMTRKEKNRIEEIRKKRRMYELVDNDRTHNEFMQVYKQNAIIVVPEIMQIINKIIKSQHYRF